MPEEIEQASALDAGERSLGGWRVIASAWLIMMIFALLFATAEALAERHAAQHQKSDLVRAEIPRHDSSFPGPDEIAASDWLQRVRAEAFACW
ncbi:MAG: hypothetical protein JO081_06795 [Alphaproteobacteria bacterium]|nr:hypothetical protein [Alphaproteobacteria bacterium]